MVDDLSSGWDAIADIYIAVRSDIGADVVTRWSRRLRPGASVLDIGCGSGSPITQALIDQGCLVHGIDASPTLLAAFRRRFPQIQTACEAAETSRFFDRRFDAAVAVGLLFLLSEESQREVIQRVGKALEPSGRFLFSAPNQACTWIDNLTGRTSVSLGGAAYEQLLTEAGLDLVDTRLDGGQNHYYDAVKNGEEPTAP